MAFVVLGLIFIVLKLMGIAPVAAWSWWWVLLPLALAFIWWEVIDPLFSLSKKRAMNDMAERQQARRQKYRESLGLGGGRRKK
ncbi:MAG: TIGR04438 family Trp-rich protein [Thiomonas sp.]|uniref:TIGR04438 family Trp-rich protein n=1 Tax=Thiomonas sp. TaxID=2047785 RepID=UPI002A36BD18|nr:TIGR04438 family Trp-rich protein [Thiomonas sp.]MDY0329442.1 TIGR04438 family Trp-rich protein [Thiomonas sp.]